MHRITPTSWAKAGKVAKLLGSLDAVLEAMGYAGVLIVKNVAEAAETMAHCPRERILAPDQLRIITVVQAYEELFRVPAGTVIGVAPNAWEHQPVPVWDRVQQTLEQKFKTVHWG